MIVDRSQSVPSWAVLPGNPPEPCPELLTTEEAVRYLRLDGDDGPKNPEDTLCYYREKGLLTGVKVGRPIRYRRVDLDEFLARQAERSNPAIVANRSTRS